MTSNIFGWLGALGTTCSFFPQVIKMYRTTEIRGVSPAMMMIHFTGVSCWIVYGVLRHDTIMIASNAVVATLVMTMTGRYVYLMTLEESIGWNSFCLNGPPRGHSPAPSGEVSDTENPRETPLGDIA